MRVNNARGSSCGRAGEAYCKVWQLGALTNSTAFEKVSDKLSTMQGQFHFPWDLHELSGNTSNNGEGGAQCMDAMIVPLSHNGGMRVTLSHLRPAAMSSSPSPLQSTFSLSPTVPTYQPTSVLPTTLVMSTSQPSLDVDCFCLRLRPLC